MNELIRNGWNPAGFWRRVDTSNPDGCWPWTAGKATAGYGVVGIQNAVHLTHRLAYELLIGPITAGLVIDHVCRNKPCCNPYHMEPVTSGENVRRAGVNGQAAVNKARTHCVNGHPFTPENTAQRGPGRVCLPCARERNRVYERSRAPRVRVRSR